ncbi:MAG: hypothetical protein JSU61_08105 [Fidelibacterota bacterium]|nr:MAG: hypothetical protein JSU61_08105 [Candidatus Neomarinimicrobiota bacterium]
MLASSTITEASEIQKETERLSRLKAGGAKALAQREQEISDKRLEWWEENRARLIRQGLEHLSTLDQAYRTFFIDYLECNPKEVPIVKRTEKQLVIHSHNFCPVHHACEALKMDTRVVCKAVYERPVTTFLQQIHPGLSFRRNYDAIRPYTWYCEEIIELVRSRGR